tara:strand:- start:168 stop:353 length:186 start_codon:yes stop_codon:yes gene_type:complete
VLNLRVEKFEELFEGIWGWVAIGHYSVSSSALSGFLCGERNHAEKEGYEIRFSLNGESYID